MADEIHAEQFLVEDYKLKTQYLTDHFSRMWIRFNFFLVINSALFGLSFNKDYHDSIVFLCSSGIILSLAWVFFGSTDNYLVDIYRFQVMEAYSILMRTMRKKIVNMINNELPNCCYSFVGNTQQKNFFSDIGLKSLKELKPNIIYRLFHWRSECISATELSVLFPFIFLVLWIVKLIFAFTKVNDFSYVLV